MNSMNVTQDFTLLERKQKNLIKLFGGLAVPFYWSDEVFKEGSALVLDSSTQDHVVLPVSGDGPSVIGFAMQEMYDDSAFGQLKNYRFFNDTRARKGNAIGVLTGTGYALTANYVPHQDGSFPAWNTQAYLALDTDGNPTGQITDTNPAVAGKDNSLPVYFEGATTAPNSGGTPQRLLRIRYSFPLIPQA